MNFTKVMIMGISYQYEIPIYDLRSFSNPHSFQFHILYSNIMLWLKPEGLGLSRFYVTGGRVLFSNTLVMSHQLKYIF